MSGVLFRIVISVLLVLELNDEGVREALLHVRATNQQSRAR